MSVQKLLIGGLVAAIVAVNGLLIPTSVQATTDALGMSFGGSFLSRWQENAGALASVLTDLGNGTLTTSLTGTVTSTLTSTLPISVPTKIPNAITNYFSGTKTVSGTFSVSASEVISLHLSGMGFGEIFKMYQLALLSGKTPDQVLAMRESGMGWGVIAKELKLKPGNKGDNLGAAVSGRGVASSPISTPSPTSDDISRKRPRSFSSMRASCPAP